MCTLIMYKLLSIHTGSNFVPWVQENESKSILLSFVLCFLSPFSLPAVPCRESCHKDCKSRLTSAGGFVDTLTKDHASSISHLTHPYRD